MVVVVKVFRTLTDISNHVLAMPRAKGRNTQHILELLDINNHPVYINQCYSGSKVLFTVGSESKDPEHQFSAFFTEDAVGVSSAGYRPFPMRLITKDKVV